MPARREPPNSPKRRFPKSVPLEQAIELVGEKALVEAAGGAYRMWKSKSRRSVPAGHLFWLLVQRMDARVIDRGELGSLVSRVRALAAATEQRGWIWEDLVTLVEAALDIAEKRQEDATAAAPVRNRRSSSSSDASSSSRA